jgi:hypothetical protein
MTPMRIVTGYLIRVNKMAPGEGRIGDLRPRGAGGGRGRIQQLGRGGR